MDPDTFRSLVTRATELTKQAAVKSKRADANVYTYYRPKRSDFERNVEINQEALSLLSEATELIRQATQIGTREDLSTIHGRLTALKKLEKKCKADISDARKVAENKASFDDYFWCEKRKAQSQAHANKVAYG